LRRRETEGGNWKVPEVGSFPLGNIFLVAMMVQ
jgi:hypothetical protein